MRGAAASLAAALLPAVAVAQPTLNGATLFGADNSGNNRPSTGSQVRLVYNTESSDRFAKVFFRTTPDAQFASGSYLNPAVDLSYQLAVGTNTFSFYGNRTDPGNPGSNFGLNLFFGTGAPASASPAISAFVARGVGNTAMADGGTCTVALDASATCVTGANRLSFVSGLYTVTLSNFQVLAIGNDPNLGGGSPGNTIDRVGDFTTGADGNTDTYGILTLTVTPTATTAPEPGTWAMLAAGLVTLGVAGRTRRRA